MFLLFGLICHLKGYQAIPARPYQSCYPTWLPKPKTDKASDQSLLQVTTELHVNNYYKLLLISGNNKSSSQCWCLQPCNWEDLRYGHKSLLLATSLLFLTLGFLAISSSCFHRRLSLAEDCLGLDDICSIGNICFGSSTTRNWLSDSRRESRLPGRLET